MIGIIIKKFSVMMIVLTMLLPIISDFVISEPSKKHIYVSGIKFDKNAKNYLSRDIILDSTGVNNRIEKSPWPMFRHDLNHTGRSQYDTSKNNGKEKWNLITGSNVTSSPSIGSDGTIYVGSEDGRLYAVYPNGTKKWDFATKASVQSSPAISSDGIIYFGSYDGDLYALYPNGTKKWNFTTGAIIGSSPIIGSDGTVLIGSESHKLYALSPNGIERWNFTTGAAIIGSSPAIGPDGTIYVGSFDGNLYALYPNGTNKWNTTIGPVSFTSPAIGSDGTIYVVSNKLNALFPNGTKKWNFNPNGVIESSPAIASDGTIYFGDGGNHLYAINPNGKETRTFETGGAIYSSPAIGSDGTIYVGADDNKVYAWLPDGTKKWDFTTGDYVESSPAISPDGTIFVGSADHKLYAIGTTPPTVPQNLQANASNAQVTLTWIAPYYNGGSEITNYRIYRGTTSGCETFLIKIGNITTYLDTSVTNGQEYFYEVTANNLIGESEKSNEANATPGTTPTAPLNLTGSPGNCQVLLNWTISADNGGFKVTNYTVYRNGTRLIMIGNVLSYTDSGLVNGMIYFYNITANNSIGESPESKGINVTPRTVPNAPRNLQVSLGNAQVILNWLVPNYNGGSSIKSYNIYRGSTSNGETLFVKGYSGGTSWVDTNITVGTKYYYMVRAVNAAGEGPRSNEQNATPFAIPDAPTLNAMAGNLKVVLSWTIPNSNGALIMNYSIYRGITSGNETLFIKGYSSSTSWVDINITIGTKYYYLISAKNIAGEGVKSNEANATPYAVPSIPTLTAISGNLKVLLSWTIPNSNGAPIMNYNIYRGTISGEEILFVKSYSGSTSWVDTNITVGMNYYYQVSAINAAGEGLKSDEKNSAPGNLPSLPTRFFTSEGDGQVILKWAAPKNGGTSVHYNIYRSDSRSGNYTFIASSNVTSYKESGLKNGHEYWYKINAQNSYGVSGNTTAASATPYGTSNDSSILLVIILVLIVVVIAVELSRNKKI